MSELLRHTLCTLLSVAILFTCGISPAVAENSGKDGTGSKSNAFARQGVKIGILAYRGAEEALTSWRATAAYLSVEIPGHSFVVVPLSFDAINEAVQQKEVDFVVTNPVSYIELETSHGISRIATMERFHGGREYNTFGGVIFCRADRDDIGGIEDLKGKSFMAVHPTSTGGWLIALRELRVLGIDPFRQLSSLRFAGSHDAVISGVRDGKADAGTVHTGVLEGLAAEGAIDLGEIKIINPMEHEGFPFLHSSRLYPEWTFATLKDTPGALAKMVAVALLKLPSSHPAATSASIGGWTIPLDYQPVHELMKELRLGPYKDYGMLNLGQFLKRYWLTILLFFAITFLLGYATLYLLKLKKEIAERKAAEAELQQSLRKREELELILNKIPAVVFLWRAAAGWPVEYVSENVRQFGYTPADFIDGHVAFAELVHRDDMERVSAEVADYSQSGASEFRQEYRLITRSGDILWTDDRTWIRRDQSGKISHYQGIVLDITERHQAEAALRLSEEKFRSFVEQSSEGVYLLEPLEPIPVTMSVEAQRREIYKGCLSECNDIMARMYGFNSADELKGLSLSVLHGAVDKPENIAFLDSWILSNYRIVNAESSETDSKGNQLWFSNNVIGIVENGSLMRIWGTQTDITQRKQAELELAYHHEHLEELVQDRTVELESSQAALVNIVEDLHGKTAELERANEKLKELDRLKSMFIASMSHELRTPLNSIIGFSGIILQGLSGVINEEQRDQLGRVSRAGKHLLSLITDVIDIAKIESGRITPYVEDFDLHALIDEAVGQVRPQAADKGLVIEERLPEDPLLLHSDRKRLLQCLLNYLSNAVKFSERGTVTLVVEPQNDEEWLEIRVSDTGIGIREEDMPLLFGSFVRLESHLKIGTPGTGLGLYLTRKLATEVLGGDVSAESREGEGSTFVLRIPRLLKIENDSVAESKVAAEAKGKGKS
ncbi:MAG: PhnD/SsuA/transferrin family substrate-binding protein [Desulfobulbaceae bacterium]